MKEAHDIVAGGGGQAYEIRIRLKAVLSSIAAFFWCAFWIIAVGQGFDLATWHDRLIGLAILLHPAIVGAAWFFWRTERPRPITLLLRPRYRSPKDLRKLYSK